MLLDILLISGVGGLVCRVYMYRQAMYVLLFYKVARNGQRPELCQLRARQKASVGIQRIQRTMRVHFFCFCFVFVAF